MKTLTFFHVLLFVLFSFSNSLIFSQIIYVKHDATGVNDGSSWQNAFTDFQDALNISTDIDMIWIAAGVYHPGGSSPDPSSFFNIRKSILIYGGFDGTESSLEERDPVVNVTILSGDIHEDDFIDDFINNKSDNTHHVMYVDSNLTKVVIDGITIKGGQTGDDQFSDVYDQSGGGLYILSPVKISSCEITQNFGRAGAGIFLTQGGSLSNITHCTFSHNETSARGAGLTVVSVSDITVKNCIFKDNQTARGALYFRYCSNILIDSSFFLNNHNYSGFSGAFFCFGSIGLSIRYTDFVQNSANNGGAIFINGSEVPADTISHIEISKCNFLENAAGEEGGGIYSLSNPDILIADCKFMNNSAAAGGGVVFEQLEDNVSDTSGVRMDNCELKGNNASDGGGGMALFYSSVKIEHCQFDSNTTQGLNDGGGGHVFQYSPKKNVLYRDVQFVGGRSDGSGGAIIDVSETSNIVLDRCSFYGNQAGTSGGGIFISGTGGDSTTALTLKNSLLGFNSAIDEGAAILLKDAKAEIISSVIYKNSCSESGLGGALVFIAEQQDTMKTKIVNTTIADNRGGIANGLEAYTLSLEGVNYTEIQNTIFRNKGAANYHSETGNSIIVSKGGNMSDDSSLLEIFMQQKDLNLIEPIFNDTITNDYSLVSNSPGIDGGVAFGAPDFDILGNARVNAPDMGAYENQFPVSVHETKPPEDEELVIAPNPVSDKSAEIIVNNSWIGPMEIRIISMSGVILNAQTIYKPLEKYSFKLSLDGLHPAVYQVMISNGDEMRLTRIIRI